MSTFLSGGAAAPAALRIHSTARSRHASTAPKARAEVTSKSDLVDLVTQKLEESGKGKLTKTAIASVINNTLAEIADQVKMGNKVQLTGFGTFEQRTRAARKGRNPRSGAVLDIAEKKYPAFSAGKGFKDTVSGDAK